MRSKARRLKAQNELGLIIVDYLQLMRAPEKAENRVQEISEISRSLKALARELETPVVALSQLSRATEQRGGDRRPILSDLRESGAIEQDADLVIFIHRPEMYKPPEEARAEGLEGKAEVIVCKQRNGHTGTVELYFHKAFTRFDDHTNRPEQNEQ
jgi:replicative DNA helicase